MRRGLFIVGLVVAIIGASLLGWGAIQANPSFSVPDITTSGAGVCVSPPILVSGPVTVQWSNGAAGTQVIVLGFNDAGCSTLSGESWNTTATSGPLTFTAVPGHTYAIGQKGNPELSMSVAIGTMTYTELIGAILLIPGAALAGIGAGLRRKEAPMPEAAPAEMAAPPPEGAPAAYAATPAPNTPPPPPASEMGASAAAAQSAATAPVAGDTGRPPILCGHCGRWNEPWLNTCRYCKRPLTSTEST